MTPTTNSQKLAELVEFTEARAFRELFRAAPPQWGWRVEQSGPATAFIAPTIDIPLFNRVIGLGLGTHASGEVIASLTNIYAEAGLKNYAIQLSPAAGPEQLPEWLSAHGLYARDNWTKVYRSNSPIVQYQKSLRVERIDAEMAGTLARIVCEAFRMPNPFQSWMSDMVGRPGWHHYLAWDGDDPVAGAAMYLSEGIGWLGVAGTLPAYRRLGAQGALLARRIQDGITLGCKWFVTETAQDTARHPNSSFHNMARSGFLLAYQRPNFMLSAP